MIFKNNILEFIIVNFIKFDFDEEFINILINLI